MSASVSAQCRACIQKLTTIVSTLSAPDRQKGRLHHAQVNDELERFTLWIGNIGALHPPESSLSLESRLREAKDVLTHVLELLDDLIEVAGELLEIVSGDREGETASTHNAGEEEDQNEETELLTEFGACITRLYRVSRLIRQAAPTDLFMKALSRNRYQFNDQYDIAHVGEKYPKLATEERVWLQKRLGRAITQRRHYLSYIRDHRDKLERMPTDGKIREHESQAPSRQHPAIKQFLDSSSRPSTFFTKASSLKPDQITSEMLAAEEESDPEDDVRSYTTISRSVDGDLDSSATVRIPKLDGLRTKGNKAVECPFCFRMKKFKDERAWRRHVFSDLRVYVCTFPDCDAPYFVDINEWFRHEMQNHRISYTCQFCERKTFQLKERYLTHVRKRHPNVLQDGTEQPLLYIARKPLDQIPALECPCCWKWVDRLKERAGVGGMPPDGPEHMLTVVPTVFKRHLASHLEQLALFAVPIASPIEGDARSDAAVEEVGAFTKDSNLSTLAYDSSRPSSSASQEQPSDDVKTIEWWKAMENKLEGRTEDSTSLLDRKGPELLEQDGLEPQVSPYKRIRGTLGDREKLDPSFMVRRPAVPFFVIGRVFKVLKPEMVGEGTAPSEMEFQVMRDPRFNQEIFVKVRWFVVVRRGSDCSHCLPIQTYSKRGVSALKTRSHHAIMYTGDDGPPDPLPQELPRTPSELPMGYPIRVIATEPWGKLDPLSRVNFRKVYTVEDNVKVYDFGIVARESMEKFLHQYNSAWGIAPTTPTSTAKHSTPGPPEHSGADLSKTNNAATTAPHDNSWIWSEEHQRHYRIIYDKNGNPVYIWQEVTPAYSRTASPGTDERKRKIFRWMTTIPQSSPPPLTITTSSSK